MDDAVRAKLVDIAAAAGRDLAALGPVADVVSVSEEVPGVGWLTVRVHPPAPEAVAGVLGPRRPPNTLFDDRPVAGEEPEPTAETPPRGVTRSFWNVFLAVSELRRDRIPDRDG